MNRNKLKAYAPQARRDFIQAVTDRAAHFGLKANKIEPMTERGDVVLIAGNAFPKAVGAKRKKLEARIKKLGFDQTMEAMAYTWFNRLVAIRFMELHGYLEHGYRVLSAATGERGVSTPRDTPEILEHAEHVDLPGLNPQKVIELKLDGTKAEELYRLLLVAQCNALHKSLPFLFEAIDDETDLLLPDHLLHSDSLIRKLVNEIDEQDWQQVEIIGWLYQFYISEKKDEVIGKVVASEDIPAATQLFTPNWIVKYLVQNTLGRQWLATYPQSSLRQQTEYYIEPAEQTPEVQEQLKAVTPTSLNPEELTLLDPACGSGHILVEAYDLFKAIYQERGYRAKDIPALILQKNLFGLEIDDRAAQLAAFALMMKARADDRRIFESDVKPNVVAFIETASRGRESPDYNAADITHALNSPILQEPSPPKEMLFEEIEEDKAGLFSKKSMGVKGHVSQADVAALLKLFEDAKTFGSLIQIPPELAAKLPEIEQRLAVVLKHGDLTQASAHVLKPLLQQARLLAKRYDVVAANPPYMGGKYYSPMLKNFVNSEFNDAKGDLYACFIQRNASFARPNCFVGMITIPNWMFLSSFEEVRKSVFDHQTIDTFIHNGRGVFGSDFGSCSFVYRNASLPSYRGTFRRLFDKQGSVSDNEELEQRFGTVRNYTPSNLDFAKIPGSPVAYWLPTEVRQLFQQSYQCLVPSSGLTTGNNELFIRRWYEVSVDQTALGIASRHDAVCSAKQWFPYHKGGDFRKWYGNEDLVVNWRNDGEDIREFGHGVFRSIDRYFEGGLTWGGLSIALASFRYSTTGHLFDSNKGPMLHGLGNSTYTTLAFLNSKIVSYILDALNPTVGFQTGDISRLPAGMLPVGSHSKCDTLAQTLVEIARNDWNSFETSWDFPTLSVLEHKAATLQQSQETADAEYLDRFQRMQRLEEENNRLFIEAYGLQDELSPEVPDDQITLYRPDREEDIKRLISYAIGCMMGRYSLDKPGLIYAHSGNVDFEKICCLTPTPSAWASGPNDALAHADGVAVKHLFLPDPDGIIPLTEFDWFADDVANRFEKFLTTAWPAEHLEENLQFVAESLGQKTGESSRETIRRYLAVDFFKHHLSMYKKRPIYWLFSSGKQRGFQALVYLHRYNEGTLARMRAEYVIPLLGKMTARLNHLTDDIAAASSSQHKKRLETEKATVTKQLAEVQTFDDKLRHYADQRVTLDLDDGVKVNYGKFSDPRFGDILADVKAITGGKEEE